MQENEKCEKSIAGPALFITAAVLTVIFFVWLLK